MRYAVWVLVLGSGWRFVGDFVAKSDAAREGSYWLTYYAQVSGIDIVGFISG